MKCKVHHQHPLHKYPSKSHLHFEHLAALAFLFLNRIFSGGTKFVWQGKKRNSQIDSKETRQGEKKNSNAQKKEKITIFIKKPKKAKGVKGN